MSNDTIFQSVCQVAVVVPPQTKRLTKPERRILRLADAERELDRVECDLFNAIGLADDTVRDLLQGIRQRVVVALAAVRTQRGEDKE